MANLSVILVDGSNVDMPALRAWLLSLEEQITNGIDAVTLAAALTVVYETRAEIDADLDHDEDTIGLVWGDPTDANNDIYVKQGASGAGSWSLTTTLGDTLDNLAAPAIQRAQNAIPFETWAALEAALGMEDGDRASVLSADEGTHVDPVAGGSVLNAGIYRFVAATPGWERIADLDSQAVNASGGSEEHFSSIGFGLENGWSLNPNLNCEFRLPGFDTGMVNLGSGNFAQNTWSNVTFFELPRTYVNDQNINLPLFASGINDNPGTNRILHLGYFAAQHAGAATRRLLQMILRGESAASAAIVLQVDIPEAAVGPFASFASGDASNAILSVYDIGANVWYDSAVVPYPSGWVGIGIFREPFTIGGEGNYTFPRDPGDQPFGAVAFKGAIGDILFCDDPLSKADVEAMANGAAIVATATASGATEYLHIPLTDGEGNIDLDVVTTQSGMEAGLTQLGRPLPGPTLRRQSTANYITVAGRKWPNHSSVEYGSDTAYAQATITTDQAGDIEFRPVRAGVALDDWRPIANEFAAGTAEIGFDIEEFTGEAQYQFRNAAIPDVIATTHSHERTGPAFDLISQSEGAIAVIGQRDSAARDDTLNIRPEGRTETVLFAVIAQETNKPRAFSLSYVRSQPGYLGDTAMAIANDIRASTDRSVLIRCHLISGTGLNELVDDSNPDRDWTDVVELNNLAGNRGRRGETVSTAMIVIGWEAAYSGTVNIMDDWYVPFFTGIGSANSGNDSAILQSELDHWAFDGTFSETMQVVILPNNRAIGTLASLSDTTDSGVTPNEADQRDVFRNYAHRLGYKIGPEAITHAIENESGGVLPSSGGTHPLPGSYEGSIEMALGVSEAIKMGMNAGRYPGPVFFGTIRAGSASDKVILKLADPDPTPGVGIALATAGYRTGEREIARPSALNLHTKKDTGDPGACFEANIDGGGWSLNNVISGVILNSREVELTLSSVPTTDVAIRYMPGQTGGYSTATINQDDFRAGSLFFTGEAYTGAEPAAQADLKKLGFAVAGSNQTLVHTV